MPPVLGGPAERRKAVNAAFPLVSGWRRVMAPMDSQSVRRRLLTRLRRFAAICDWLQCSLGRRSYSASPDAEHRTRQNLTRDLGPQIDAAHADERGQPPEQAGGRARRSRGPRHPRTTWRRARWERPTAGSCASNITWRRCANGRCGAKKTFAGLSALNPTMSVASGRCLPHSWRMFATAGFRPNPETALRVCALRLSSAQMPPGRKSHAWSTVV
jgi:hypothetical protein